MSTLTEYFDKIRALAPEVEPLVAVVEVAQSVTGIGGPGAATALKVLDAALQTLAAGAAGSLTHDQMMAQIAQFHANLRQDQSAEDAALAAKFPAGGA
ncbi:MAG TPA: hypothetical protein VFQ42_22230 [Mycobacterium sp.]|nr:hypothetical protein [Mycobacterium sp.]